MKILSTRLIFVLILLYASFAAFAQCTESNAIGGDSSQSGSIVGQTFTTSCAGNLLSANFNIAALSGSITNATVSVRTGVDPGAGSLVGAALTGVTLTTGDNTFDFSLSNVTLANATQYILVIDDNGSPESISPNNSNSASYAGGNLWADVDRAGRDAVFSFYICGPPTAAATSAVFGSETTGSLELTSWTAPMGGADGYAVYINSTNSFTAPANGAEPVANTTWANSGQQAIYFGTSNSPAVTVTGLDDGVTYYFQVYSYTDCSSGTETYETTGLNANDITSASVPTYTATWLDSNTDGNIDQLRLDFSENVTISDGGGAGDGFNAITITGGVTISNADYSSASTSSLLLNITGVTGTAIPPVTIGYTNANSSHILSDDTSTEVANTAPSSVIDGANPVLLNSTPADNATGVAVGANIVLTFSENVVAGTGNFSIVDVSGPDDRTITLPNAQVVFSTNTITINPSADLLNFTSYALNVATTSVDDATGNSYAGISDNTTLNFQTVGAIPTFTATWQDVNGNGNLDRVVLTFSVNVDIVDGNAGDGFGAILLNDGSAVTIDNADYAATNVGTLTLNFTGDEITGTGIGSHSVTYSNAGANAITANDGGLEVANGVATAYIDGANPVLLNSTPADNATGVAVGANIVLTFSENVVAGTGAITLVDVTGAGADNRVITLPNAQAVFSTNTITVNPSTDLQYEKNYAVNVATTAVDDAIGNSYAGITNNTTLDFTTPDTPLTITAATWLDNNGDGTIDRLQLTFSENVNITDAGGAGDGFNALTVTGGVTIANGDYSATNVSSVTFIVSGVTGSASPASTVTYNTAGTSTIVTNTAPGGLEIVNGVAASSYVDGAQARFTGNSLQGSNAYVDVTFSEGVYNNVGGGLVAGNFQIFGFTNNGSAGATAMSISDITTTADAVLVGGETTIRFVLNVTGTADANDQFEIRPLNGSSVYDAANNPMGAATTTGTIILNAVNPANKPVFISAIPNSTNSHVRVVFNVAVDRNASTTNDQEIRYKGNGNDELNHDSFVDPDAGPDATLSISDGALRNLANGAQSTGTVWRLNITQAGSNPSGNESFRLFVPDAAEIYNSATGDNMDALDITVFFADELGDDFSNATAIAYDLNLDGNIDAVDVTMPDGITDATVSLGNFAFNGINPSSFSTGTTPNDNAFRLLFTAYTGTAVVGNLVYTAGTLRDDAAASSYDGTQGNLIASGSITPVDAAGPVVASARTRDNNLNGRIDRIEITMSENVIAVGTLNSADVAVGGGYTVSSVSAITGATFNVILNEIGAGFDTNVRPSFTLNASSVEDAAGADNPLYSVAQAADGAAPYGTVNSLTTVDDTPPLSGTVDDPTAVVLVNVGSQTRTATNNGNGTWNLADNSLTTLSPGLYEVTAILIDAFGNTGFDITSTELTISAGLNIVAPNYTGCTDGNYAAFDGPIILDETDAAGISSGGTIRLILPDGFEFNTSITPSTAGSTLNDISGVSFSYPSVDRLTITLTTTGTSGLDELQISGIQVRAIGPSTYSNVKMTRSGGTAGLSTTDTDYANLTSNLSEPALTSLLNGVTSVTQLAVSPTPRLIVNYTLTNPLLPFTNGETFTFSNGVNATMIPGTNTGSSMTLVVNSGSSVTPGETITGSSSLNTGSVTSVAAGTAAFSSFTLVANPGANTAAWYTSTGTPINVDSGGDAQQTTADNVELGVSNLGLYSYDISVDNGVCENQPLRFNILAYSDLDGKAVAKHSFTNRTFLTTQEKDTIFVTEPSGHTISVTGVGVSSKLQSTNNADARFKMYFFDPNLAGQGNHVITYTTTNISTSESIVLTVTFRVEAPKEIFTENAPLNISVADLPYTLTFAPLTIPGQTFNFLEFDNFTNGQNGFWYRFNTTGSPNYATQFAPTTFPYTFNLDPRSTNLDPFTRWTGSQTSNTPIDVPNGDAVALRSYLSLQNPSLVIQQNIFIYGRPIVQLTNIEESYCSDAAPFTIMRGAKYVDGFTALNAANPATGRWRQDYVTEEADITTGYQLLKQISSAQVASGGGYNLQNTLYNDPPVALANGVYEITLFDCCDGIYEPGYFRLIDANNKLIYEDAPGQFREDRGIFTIGPAAGSFTSPVRVEYLSDVFPTDNSWVINQLTFTPYANLTATGTLSNDFDPTDPDQDGNTAEDESGTYLIIYTSEGLTPASVTGSTTQVVKVTPPPAQPDIAPYHAQGYGGAPWYDTNDMNNSMSTIVMDFCDENSVSSLFYGDYLNGEWSFNWYNEDMTLIGSNIGYLQKGQAFDDPLTNNVTEVVQAGNSYIFWFERVVGDCTSDLRKMVVNVYDQTDIPTAVTTSNNEDVEANRYVYEFCDAYSTITLNTLTSAGSNPVSTKTGITQRFNLYDQDKMLQSQITDNTLDAVDFLNGSTTDTTIYISQVWNDGTSSGVTYLDPAYQFAGCEGDLIQLDIRIITTPTAPVASEFSVKTLTIDICEGDVLSSIQNSSTGTDEYVWNLVGVPGNTVTIQNGGFIDQPTLISLGFNNNVPGTYSFEVLKTVGIGTETDFQGCYSPKTTVDIIVHDYQSFPTIVSDNSAVPSVNDFVDLDGNTSNNTVSYAVCTNQVSSGLLISASSAYGGPKIFKWYDEFDNLIFTGTSASFSNLGLVGASSDDYVFTVTQTVDGYTDAYGIVFAGCESNPITINIALSDPEDLDFSVLDQTSPNPLTGYSTPSNLIISSDNIFCAEGLGGNIVTLDFQAGASSANPANLTYDVTHYPVDFADAGSGNLSFDVDSWHDQADGVATDYVGGISTYHVIVVTYNDPVTQCVDSRTAVVRIDPQPEVSFTMSSSTTSYPITTTDINVCYDGGQISLAGYLWDGVTQGTLTNSSGGTYTTDITPGAIIPEGGNRAKFDVKVAQGNDQFAAAQTHQVTFDYQTAAGCDSSVVKSITVHPNPQFSGTLGNQIQFDALCRGYDIEAYLDVLNLDPADLTFSWTVEGNTITVVGDNTVTIPATNAPSVFISVQVYYTVIPGTSIAGCPVTINEFKIQGEPPVPAFTYTGITGGQANHLRVQLFEENQNLNNADVDFVEFSMTGGPTSVATIQLNSLVGEVIIPEALAPGQYTATLTMGTINGCLVDSEVRTITILEHITDPNLMAETFTGGIGNWYIEVASENGKTDVPYDATTNPDGRISSWVAAGGRVISGDGSDYKGNEFSYVYSPAYDLTSFTDPAIKFERSFEFDSRRDGVVVQVSTDDGATWIELGDNQIQSGILWYNDKQISSAPGEGGRLPELGTNNELVGFSGTEVDENGNELLTTLADKRESRHRVGDYLGPLVRFRFALSAIGGDKGGAKGFEFDNFDIYEVDKKVLVEQFSSLLSADSKAYEEYIQDGNGGADHDIKWNEGTSGLWINYYSDLYNSGTNVDVINARNKVDPGTRMTYYGINNIPDTRIAGLYFDYDLNVNPDDFGNAFAAEGLNDPEFDINNFQFDTSPGVPANELRFSAEFVANSVAVSGAESELAFFFAIVEKKIPAVSTAGVMNGLDLGYGEYTANTDTIRHALRKLLPGSSGNVIRTIVADGQMYPNNAPLSASWVIDGVYNVDQLRVIAYVQNYNTGEILQAEFIDVSDVYAPGEKSEIVTGLKELLSKSGYNIYPTPSDEVINLELSEAPEKDVYWKISDQAGREVLKGMIHRGSKSPEPIDSSKLPSGLYIIQLQSDDRTWMPRKVLISH